ISIEVSGKAPGARQLVRIIDRARAEGIRVIFVQPQFDQRAAERIAAAIGGVVIPLDPLAYDYIANMETVAAEIRKAIEP
ncbi:MAG: zinc ABC transporter substrate-binding protein, partial [Kiritimatiellae bacterium]|nr:zinc ABC transporter substrate-binding protein [Kiritimatiellia bacterium]